MNFEEDFVKEELVEFQIDGRSFKYKPTTAGEETSWYPEYMESFTEEENGQSVTKQRQNLMKVAQCKMLNLKEVPYDQEVINKIAGIDKPWETMGKDERWKIMEKLSPGMFNKILVKINQIDNPQSEPIKN